MKNNDTEVLGNRKKFVMVNMVISTTIVKFSLLKFQLKLFNRGKYITVRIYVPFPLVYPAVLNCLVQIEERASKIFNDFSTTWALNHQCHDSCFTLQMYPVVFEHLFEVLQNPVF